jgi:hypothetical protein
VECQNQYVPDILSPNYESYGDYICMEVDAEGTIKGWDSSLLQSTADEVVWKDLSGNEAADI